MIFMGQVVGLMGWRCLDERALPSALKSGDLRSRNQTGVRFSGHSLNHIKFLTNFFSSFFMPCVWEWGRVFESLAGRVTTGLADQSILRRVRWLCLSGEGLLMLREEL